ncbi:MAG: diguanylate cyclase [Clostridia bacterium]|nr:diguanylate cyclase [Clostridia bacterium]
MISENNRLPRQKKRLFYTTNILMALAAIAEWLGLYINGNAAFPAWMLASAKAADYILTPLTGITLILLMLQPGKTAGRISRLMIALYSVFQLVSVFCGWTVVIDSSNRYTHGPLYPVYMVFNLAVIVGLALSFIRYSRSFRKHNRVALYAIMLLIFISMTLQELGGSSCRVAYLGMTFGVAYLYIHYTEFAQMQMNDTITEQQVRISIDPLTGVHSRLAYTDALKACGDTPAEDTTVFLIDINGLKNVNDTLGHEAGDELIRGAADRIRQAFPDSCGIYRIGGDEFVVLGEMTEEQIHQAPVQLNKAMFAWHGTMAKAISMSSGCARKKDHPECSMTELIKLADQAMYEQKKAYYQSSGADRRRR